MITGPGSAPAARVIEMPGTSRPPPRRRSRGSAENLWVWRTAGEISLLERLLLITLLAAGAIAVLRLFEWWFRAQHVAQPTLFVLLSLAFWYGISRIVLAWFAYGSIRRPAHRPPREGKPVAIFTTSSPGEPLSMFEATLAACVRIHYPHTTYLLDDTRDPHFREVAERHGAVWLSLVDLPGAKAGKINGALEITDEEFILVLDPDHIPFPEFLDRVIGHFDDPQVGFVQVAQAYYNQARSFVARGAAEQTYSFYGPLMMGMAGHGTSVAIGANCTFRRTALESIGGHGTGLAEDLVTAIRLHTAGWRSVYVPEVVSRGLVPEDLGSFYRQQLKWARGVNEVLFAELPRHFFELTWQQKLSYSAIGTYYLAGVTTLLFLILPYLFLWWGIQAAAMSFAAFLTAAGPVAILGVAIYLFVQRWLCHPAVERGLHWRGLVLKIGCWPVYVAGTLLAIVRFNIPYVPTAKEAVRGRFLQLAWPHLAVLASYAVTVSYVLYQRMLRTPAEALMLTSETVWGMVSFATASALMLSGAVYAAWTSRRPPSGSAWSGIDPDALGGNP